MTKRKHRLGFCQKVQKAAIDSLPLPVGEGTLEDWGLPAEVCSILKRSFGITSLYAWQRDCLEQLSVTGFSTAIYSAPTSGGKSLVADILMFRRLFFSGQRALVVCPFVSICRERSHFLRQVFGPLGIVVKEFHGPVNGAWTESVDIAVCTVQKAIAIIHTLPSIGTVVVDEFHLVFEMPNMESLVSKLGLLPERRNILLVGMSATLPPGIEPEMVHWLERSGGQPCLTFACAFRPISLSVFVKRGAVLRPLNPAICEPREISPLVAANDKDLFVSLCLSSQKKVPTIVFCATRNWCEKAAQTLAQSMMENEASSAARSEMVEALALLSPCGVHPVLKNSILAGIAFHHAGLTSEERAIIELGFRNRVIWLLCATSTIAAGVNLPANRVILRTLSAASGGQAVRNASEISAKLKQMIGRAGRAGLAEFGEAVVMCSSVAEEKIVIEALSFGGGGENLDKLPKIPPKNSGEIVKFVAKEVLETILFFKKSSESWYLSEFSKFKFFKNNFEIPTVIDFLVKAKLCARVSDSLVPTAIGEALAFSAMSPDEAERTFAELSLARNRLCLSQGDLHLLFLIVPPISISDKEFDEFASSPLGMHALERSRELLNGGENFSSIGRQKRLMVALILRDLITDYNIGQVAAKFKVPSGTVQYLQSNAATYCAMVAAFCEKLQWNSLAAALNSVKPRLHFGVPAELLPLMELESVSPARARALAAAGFTTTESIARAAPLALAIALTRDVLVEGTQMTTNATAKRLLEITCRSIISEAQSKDEFFVMDPISPPLMHQLMSQTQVQATNDDKIESSIADNDLVEFSSSRIEKFSSRRKVESSIADSDLVEISAVKQTFFDEFESIADKDLLEVENQFENHTHDEDFLLAKFKSPKAKVRRISEMTTVKGETNEFGLPLNVTCIFSQDN